MPYTTGVLLVSKAFSIDRNTINSSSSDLLTSVNMCALGVQAFILSDINFFTVSKVQLCRNFALQNPDVVMHVKVIFHWQNNGYHSIHRWMSRNDDRIYLCAVRAWIRIVH